MGSDNLAMSDRRVPRRRAWTGNVGAQPIALSTDRRLPRARVPRQRAAVLMQERVMKSFVEREKAFEAEFKRNEELAFRLAARRNKLFGLWAASRMGIPAGEAADSYAKTVVAADFEAPGDGDVVEKVRADLTGSGIELSEKELRAELERAAAEARAQLSGP